MLVACNGCDDLTDLYGFPGNETTIHYNNASDTLRHSLGLSPVAIGRGRRPGARYTQEQEICSCTDVTISRRSLLEADVTDALDPLLKALEVPCIGNSSECNFGSPFIATMLCPIQVGPSTTLETAAKILEMAFSKVVRRMISGENATLCTCDMYLHTSSYYYGIAFSETPRSTIIPHALIHL